MVDQMMMDINERLTQLEKNLAIINGNIGSLAKALETHQHMSVAGTLSGQASIVKIEPLFEEEAK